MAKVQLNNIAKHFAGLWIIENLNLTIDDGEFVVLVGASGCGKSTTLRMIAGLESSTDGTIMIGDCDVTELGPGKRNCAMVFQSYALYPHMTVAENMGFGLRLRGMSKADMEIAVNQAAETLGLTQLLERLPKALSGGQRQRVAIGRAIVRKPDVFLFDEPLSNLDAKLRIEMRTEIKELHRRLGTTIIYVTHDQVEAMTMADRVVVMDKGKIIQAASPLTLYQKPANQFVAEFIGAPSMNFLPCTYSNSGKIPKLTLPDGSTVLLAKERGTLKINDGEPVILGLRPENIRRGKGKLQIEVRSVEPLGSHTLAIGRMQGHPITVQLSALDRLEAGSWLPIDLEMNNAHFFDGQSGTRLM